MNKEDKFVVINGTDIACIGGFGNLKGNLELLKYSEEDISDFIKDNNNEDDNIRLVNSLLESIRELNNNWNELKNKIIDLFNRSQDVCYLDVLEVMQEIESRK